MGIKSRIVLQNYRSARNKVRYFTRWTLIDEQKDLTKSSKVNPKKFYNYVNTRLKNINYIGDLGIKSKNGDEKSHQ
jgi:hypothetical protein